MHLSENEGVDGNTFVVPGGLGFVGAALCLELVRRGARQVRSFDLRESSPWSDELTKVAFAASKVSLRGASSGELSRDALLAKVSQERERRSYTRRANAATLFIQRVWRSYIVRKMAAIELREEWENS